MFSPLRMLLQPMVVLLLVSTSSAVVSADQTPTCKRLTDSDSPFLSGLSVLLGPNGLIAGSVTAGANPLPKVDPEVFAAIDKSLPALSQCVAETSPLDLLGSLMASPAAQQCWRDLSQMDRDSSSSNSNDGGSGSEDDDSGITWFHDDVCPAVEKIAPCLTDVLVPAIERVMATSHGCCDPLSAQIEAVFGSKSLKATISTIVSVLGNALCSTREHTSSPTSSTVETCGDSLLNNWIPQGKDDDDEKIAQAVLNSLQIPNSQVCKAVGGEPFQTTTRTSQQYGAPDITAYGACYAPMDELLQYVRGLPLWKLYGPETSVIVDQVFGEDDRCLPGEEFLKWAGNENGPVLKSAHIVDDVMNLVFTLTGHGERPASQVDASHSGSGNDHDEAEPSEFDSSASTDGDDSSEEPGFATAVRMILEEATSFVGDMCVHLPNGVPCDFPDDTLEEPFTLSD